MFLTLVCTLSTLVCEYVSTPVGLCYRPQMGTEVLPRGVQSDSKSASTQKQPTGGALSRLANQKPPSQ